ncbi:gamma-glutamyltransferase [Dongia deserti]|uniref:gamma-glutamyltransferase n=1 Tax=Dongia deserti TaxID=2268030 RepID=UPI002547940E|nr:gamma-glutamyltransferase [Dongia deserti]
MMTDDPRVSRTSPSWSILAFALLGLLAGGCVSAPEPRPTEPLVATQSGIPTAPEAVGDHFMVATADPAASEAALAILRKGGSAVDAAVAAQAVLGLVEPQSSGIGGGAFLLHWDGVTHKLSALDGRETAPKSARADLFLDKDGKPLDFLDAALSGKSVGVPGALRVLELAHRREGRLPWADLFQPAIDLAENGFAVPPALAAALSKDAHLKRDPEARAYFYDSAGNPWPAGAILRNPAYAETLRTVAEGGADVFYRGPIAQAILAAVNEDGVEHMTAIDLVEYRAREREALCRPYRVYQVCSMGPPTSGGIALLQILGILQNFDLPPMDPNGPQAFHLIADASRLAFADRDRYVADSDFARVPAAKMLDADYLKARAGQIRSDRTIGEAQPGRFTDPLIVAQVSQQQFEPVSTSHFVIVDSAGDIVSLTSSVEMAFGSHRMVKGFLLNNQLTDFSFLPASGGRATANRVEAGKRPRSSMTPTIVFDRDGRPAFALGSPGGPNIIGYVAQALIEMIDWGRSPGAAAAAPHILNRNGPTLLEAGTNALELRDSLQALGHEVEERELRSGLNIVQFKDGRMIGASDRRRDGIALGE